MKKLYFRYYYSDEKHSSPVRYETYMSEEINLVNLLVTEAESIKKWFAEHKNGKVDMVIKSDIVYYRS